jgi:tRNA threonylcarbamoyladenosine biosynthesis protein TsaB
MNILIDTAVRGCNLALFNRNDIVSQKFLDIERGHAEAILPLYEEMLNEVDASSKDLKQIYVTIGPGSFTGLRVGLTVAQFMAYSLQVPVHGIDTFQAFSCGHEGDGDRLVVIETKRKDYYCQILSNNHKALSEPQSLTSDEIMVLIAGHNIMLDITGDAADRLNTEIPFSGNQQDTINVGEVVKAIQDKALDLHKAEGFYIRDADVTMPKV